VTDGYRKLRNTARFALGNLHGFDPARDVVPDEDLLEIDRWALAKLNEVVGKVRAAYDGYEFHLVYHLLSEFCTVTLSARYFDIIKDRLYTFAPRNQERRSAQTALYQIADALARMLAPILVFTADEIWENLPGRNPSNGDHLSSVHLTMFPAAHPVLDTELMGRWETIFKVREEVLRELEAKRIGKIIGSSLEARVKLSVTQDTYELLKPYQDRNELRYIFIVSQTELLQGEARPTDGVGATPLIAVEVERASGQKCDRCWNYSTHVGESAKYPTVCERCVVALDELEKEAA
jgi:isoleucyl-tRNA synthetase